MTPALKHQQDDLQRSQEKGGETYVTKLPPFFFSSISKFSKERSQIGNTLSSTHADPFSSALSARAPRLRSRQTSSDVSRAPAHRPAPFERWSVGTPLRSGASRLRYATLTPPDPPNMKKFTAIQPNFCYSANQ